MENKIIIYRKGLYKEVPLLGAFASDFHMGTDAHAQLRFVQEKFEVDFSIRLSVEEAAWKIACSEKICFQDGTGRTFAADTIRPGDDLKVINARSGQELFSLYFGFYFEETASDYNKRIDCRQINTFRIGGCATSTIRILDPAVKDTEVILSQSGEGYEAELKGSFLGVSLNGCQVRQEKIQIHNHDFCSVNGHSFYFCDGWLYFSEQMPVSTGLFAEVVHTAKNHMTYPVFIRSVRQMYEMPSEKIEVLPPKEFTGNPGKNLVMTIMPVMVSMMFMMVMRLFMGRSAIYAVYSAGMMLVSGVMAVWNYKHQGKEYLLRMKNRVEKYNQYIAGSEEKIIRLREKEQRIARQKCPSLAEQLSFVSDFDARLFERRPEDGDFLSCYMGTGKVGAENQVDFKKQEYVDVEDPLMDYPEMIHDKYRYAENMPVMLELKDKSAVGIVGERGRLYQMLKNLMMTLSISHYFNEVKFSLFIHEEDIPYFQWVRWLQNVNNEGLGRRNIGCDEKSSGQLLEYLYTELSAREGRKGFEAHHVVFAYRDSGLGDHPINKYFKQAKELGFTFLFFEEYPEFLNKACEVRVFLSSGNFTGYIQDAKNGEDIRHFSYPHITAKEAEEAALKMSCVYVEETNLESRLTKNITLFELMHISSVTQLNLGKRWSSSKIYESMAAPLGVKSGDETVYLDLHEKFHGPHGLVAGTTGSGKSEILQSYILSMATLFHPYEVGFIIIDFKGGGMVNQFKALPHLNGAITNIDGKQIDRSLMSIRAELLKRQELFAQHEVNHIDEYIKLFKAGKAEKPLPHLILIVDEFAELKSEQPEFMKELISAARIGRSLGVHLILATQKPAGVVNEQIWSNSNFKLCLRVQTKEDSNEVLKSPLAAEIREPGRAYLQVGNNELFLLFQSGYSGAVVPRENVGDIKEFTISRVDICGNRLPVFEQKRPESDSDVTQLDALVDYIADFCRKSKIEKLPDICLPPLAEHIPYTLSGYEKAESDVCIPLGYYDNPSRQLQAVTELNLTQSNVLVVGATQSGKTNVLQVILRAAAELYPPESVNFYLLDFASMVLKRFHRLAHVSGVVTLREDDTMKSFMKMIMEELNRRKDLLSEKGFGSYSVYRESGAQDLPQIILMLDNMAVFRELFPKYEEAFLTLSREGIAVGITIVATSMQANAMGMRMIANFGKRLALYATDAAVYGQVFDRCKIKPDNTPGRFITEIDKEVYEGQCFAAFEAEKENEKMEEIDRFIAAVNEKYKGSSAARMEVLPEIVTGEYLRSKDALAGTDGKTRLPYTIAVGVDYLSIEIKRISLLENNVWGILEKEHVGSTNFVKYVIQSLVDHAKEEPVQIRIVDHISRKLDLWGAYPDIVQYSYNPAQVMEYVAEMVQILEERYQRMMDGKEQEGPKDQLVLLINSAEAYKLLGENLKAQGLYNKMVGQYRGLGMSLILGKLPNVSLNFNMPLTIKTVRDGMNVFIFQNIGEQRLLEIPPNVGREYAKNLEVGDAYLIEGTNLSKIKTPLWERK
ncbi:MAG: type VII secretion protein EssC [Lachnospiraceae bacterium]|nr:type VII secretion protein EssC [Lachnospiraceae bacterium]